MVQDSYASPRMGDRVWTTKITERYMYGKYRHEEEWNHEREESEKLSSNLLPKSYSLHQDLGITFK